MKRIIQALVFIGILCFGMCSVFAANGEGVVNHVYVNGQEVHCKETQPFIKDNRTFVPLRSVVEQLGVTVSWRQRDTSAFLFRDGMCIRLQVGSPNMEISSIRADLNFEYTSNKIVVPIDDKQDNVVIVPLNRNGRVLLPLRAVCEALGASVDWDNDKRDVIIVSEKELLEDPQLETSKNANYYVDYLMGLQYEAKEANPKTFGVVNLKVPESKEMDEILNENPLKVTIVDLTNLDPSGNVKVSKKALIKGYTFLPVGEYTIVVDPETVPEGYRVAGASPLKVNVTAQQPTSFDIIVKNIDIKADPAKGGTVSVDNPNAKKGDKVVITVTPKEGYKVTQPIVVKDKDGKEIKVNKDNSFTMPDSYVTISVKFEKDEVAPAPAEGDQPAPAPAEGDQPAETEGK